MLYLKFRFMISLTALFFLTLFLLNPFPLCAQSAERPIDSQQILANPLDRATVESSRIWMLRIRDRESMLIKKIRQSLEDIENDEYGICKDCGEDISIERLKARPVTSICISCKTNRESVEKLTEK